MTLTYCPSSTPASLQYIRTITEVRPEWLLQYAPAYYDPSELKGEVQSVMKRAQDTLKASSKIDKKKKKAGK